MKGLLIGRFQNVSKVTEEQFPFILNKHPWLKQILVLFNLDFGHTQPICTLPIGGKVRIDTSNEGIQIIEF
ncbi:hypothetical protein MKY27_05870 [Solibacillus sp. FSL R5-0449]|uniref:hypothetical protein n=1 Tax=Solibacillus sp. FSL R5-0449 TaxID=2921639 RepID=UPI0030D59F1A